MEAGNNNSIERLLAAGAELMVLQDVGGIPYHLVSKDVRIERLERFLKQPSRRRGVVKVQDPNSFVEYFNEFGLPHSKLFVNVANPEVRGIIDYSTPIETEWHEHQVVFKPEESAEWKLWSGIHDKWLYQRDMAEFLESNIDDVVEPAGARILEITRTLQARQSVEFKSGVRLDNGDQQLTFEQKTEASAGAKGNFSVPPTVIIGIPVFRGFANYRITLALRYRITSGTLALKFDLLRKERLQEGIVKDILADIEKRTQRKALIGTDHPEK